MELSTGTKNIITTIREFTTTSYLTGFMDVNAIFLRFGYVDSGFGT